MRSLPTSVCSRRAASSRASGEGRCSKSCRWSAIEDQLAFLTPSPFSYPSPTGGGAGGGSCLYRLSARSPDSAPPRRRTKAGREKKYSLGRGAIQREIERQDVDVGFADQAGQRTLDVL